jgi:hypothetical protein
MAILDTLSKFEQIDRRIWYILLLILVSTPLIRPIGLPIAIVPATHAAYNYLEALPAGANVVFCPTSSGLIAECGPVQLAMLKHLFSLDVKILFEPTLEGHLLLETYFFPRIEASAKYGAAFQAKVYGEDYLVLPYLPQNVQTWASFASDTPSLFVGMNDHYNLGLINDFPIMQSFVSANDWDLYITVGGEPTFTNKIQVYQAPYDVPFIELAQSMHWSIHRPYWDAGQIVGMTNGLRGGAEYESLIGEATAAGLGGMDAFSITYTVLWIILIFGNVLYILRKQRGSGER